MSMMIVSSEEFESECELLGISRPQHSSSSAAQEYNFSNNEKSQQSSSIAAEGNDSNLESHLNNSTIQTRSSEAAEEYGIRNSNSESNNSSDNPTDNILPIIKDPTPLGRGLHHTEVPNSVRKVIAQEAIAGSSAKSIMESFHTSQSSISAYKRGLTSLAHPDRPNSELLEHNEKIRNKISSAARNRLILALKHITPDKLESAKVRDAASVAKDMSVIVRNMNEQLESSVNNNIQFIIHRPRMRSIDDFDVIESNE